MRILGQGPNLNYERRGQKATGLQLCDNANAMRSCGSIHQVQLNTITSPKAQTNPNHLCRVSKVHEHQMVHHMECECDDSLDASSRGREADSKLESNLTKPQLEDKRSAVHAELARVTKLPSNSTYAIHRARVLHKLLHLLSIQRTVSQDDELELLFATLSL